MQEVESNIQQPQIALPDGSIIESVGPIVIVGPNGAGKSTEARKLSVHGGAPFEMISALRNTRVPPQLSPMANNQARSSFESHKVSAIHAPYDLTDDFAYMLVTLIGEAADAALNFMTDKRVNNKVKMPPVTQLEEIQQLWGQFFPGRVLKFKDHVPTVVSRIAGAPEETSYSAWQMSDGEKAALYLVARALCANPEGVLIVDEPETHLHSLLAVQLWDAIERLRPRMRVVYLTHDMTFAASRRASQYLLASPGHGLTAIDLSENSEDLAEIILGAATLSFYAKKVVFCEGGEDGLDALFYRAWYGNSGEVVVRPVGSSETVIRSTRALAESRIVANIESCGIVDRDYMTDAQINGLRPSVAALGLHEIESLFALPGVISVVADYMGKSVDLTSLSKEIASAYSDIDKQNVILERWKRIVTPQLSQVASSVVVPESGIEALEKEMNDLFKPSNWDFSPGKDLATEKDLVRSAFEEDASIDAIMRLMPGKPLVPIVQRATGLKWSDYQNLVVQLLSGQVAGDVPKCEQRLRVELGKYISV